MSDSCWGFISFSLLIFCTLFRVLSPFIFEEDTDTKKILSVVLRDCHIDQFLLLILVLKSGRCYFINVMVELMCRFLFSLIDFCCSYSVNLVRSYRIQWIKSQKDKCLTTLHAMVTSPHIYVRTFNIQLMWITCYFISKCYCSSVSRSLIDLVSCSIALRSKLFQMGSSGSNSSPTK